MSTSIHVLDLPIQLFALGTAAGMLAALVRYNLTGELDHWPVYVAYFGLLFFGIGLLFVASDALP